MTQLMTMTTTHKFPLQLMGISLRAGIPLPLDLMPTFWRSMVNRPVREWSPACQEIDPTTCNYIHTLEGLTEDKFEEFLDEHNHPKFTYASLGGAYVELCGEGVSRSVSWANLAEYVDSVKRCRLKEWECAERVAHIQAGEIININCEINVQSFQNL